MISETVAQTLGRFVCQSKVSTEFLTGPYNPDVITMSAGQTALAKQGGWLAKYISPQSAHRQESKPNVRRHLERQLKVA